MFLLFSLFTLSKQSKFSIAELITHNRGNLSINFRSTELINEGTVFSIPSLKQRFSLSINQLVAKKSFAPFIFGESFNLNANIKMSKSIFKNFKSNAISLSTAENIDLANQQIDNTGGGGGSSFYARGDTEGITVTVASCSFINFQVIDPYAAPDTTQSYQNSGGVFYLYRSSTISITNSIFTNCQATIEGGAILIYEGRDTTTISGCQFNGCTSCFGNAICLESTPSVTISTSFFMECIFAPLPNQPGSGYDGATIYARDSQITTSDCTFYNSYYTDKPENLVEIYGINSNQQGSSPTTITATRICSTVRSEIDLGSYIIVYYFNPPSTVTPSATEIYASTTGVILYYFDATNQATSSANSGVSDCPTIPQPTQPPATEPPPQTETPSQTQAPPQTETPSQTQAPPQTETPSQTQAPAQTETPSQTQTPAQTDVPILPSQSVVPSPDPTAQPNNQEESGLTDKEKVTIAWVVPVVIIILIIIAIVIYCLLKDRRTAFKGDQIEGDEYAFPAV